MKRLLLLAPQPFFQERGTPIATLGVARVLVQRGYDVDLLVYHEGEDVELEGCAIHRISEPPGISDVPPGFSFGKAICDAYLARKAWGMVRRERYDLVHAVEEAVFVARALRASYGLPYVYDMDSSLPDQMAGQVRATRLLRPIMNVMERTAVRGAAGVLTMCESLADHARAMAPGAIVGCAEDVTALGDGGGSGVSERLADTVGRRGPIVLYVGNLMPYQGIDLLLGAFERVARMRPDATLVVIGGSKENQARYRAKVARAGLGDQVHLVGPRPLGALGWYLRQATVLVSPRVQGENTPLKIYSYMDSGVPVAATRLPTHTQVLDEQTAELAPPEPEAFGDAILRLLNDDGRRQTVADRARALVQAEYTPEAFERKVNSFYDRVEEAVGIVHSGPRATPRRIAATKSS